MVDREMLELNMKCPICLSIADDPCESSCCGHLFCNFCVKKIKYQKCPICRDEDVEFNPNTFVKNLMKEMKVQCKFGCSQLINLSELKIHRFICTESKFKCSVDNCNFEGKREESLEHFAESHTDDLVIMTENFSSLKNIFEKLSIYNILQKHNIKDKMKDLYEILKDNK
jgi:hypothetical protein